MIAAGFIAKCRAADPVPRRMASACCGSRTHRTRRTAPADTAAPSGGSRRSRLPGHPPAGNLACTNKVNHSTISRLTVWPIAN